MTAPTPVDPREIQRLVHKYAECRTVPLMISLVLATALFSVFVLIAKQVTREYSEGQTVAFWLWLGALVVAATGGLSILFFDDWGVRFRQAIADRIYGAEGRVTLDARHSARWRAAGVAVGLIFSLCFIATALLTMRGVIPRTHVQPWTAAYMVPFLTFLVLWHRPTLAPQWGLIWPALYGLHAIAILLGAPIVFTGQWKFMSMLIPLFGYGLVAGIVGHIRSRVLLRRIRALTGNDFASVSMEGDGEDAP